MTSSDDLIDAERELIASMVESAKNESGTLNCRFCGRELEKGEYLISLMGRGATCNDFVECAAEFGRQVQAGIRRLQVCDRCFREIPLRDMRLDKGFIGIRGVVCIDAESCGEASARLETYFEASRRSDS